MGTGVVLACFAVTLLAPLALGALDDFVRLAAFGLVFRVDFRAGAFFLADACRFDDRFAAPRVAARPLAAFRPGFAGAARLVALRLAIASVLSEP
jgi:hypothetical protein